MTKNISAAPPVEGTPALFWKRFLPSLVLLTLFWGLIFNQLRLEWTVNVTYAYGWAVPLLALYLFRERWQTRPVMGQGLPTWLIISLGIVLLAAYLPVRVIQEANPDWVKINWLMTGLCAGLSLIAVAAVGGVRFSLYFLFPILFCFTALPWPVWFETYLLQELMRINASFCAEILSMAGIPAMAEGNLIQVASRWVNVEEACSGIRSMQTAFMVSLFLGEFYRFSVVRRFMLLIASFVAAFVINLGRTVYLTYLSSQGDVSEKTHDNVGIVAMIGGLVALWLLSEVFRPRGASAPPAPRPAPAASSLMRMPWPAWFALSAAVWLVGVEGFTSWWYDSHEEKLPPSIAWHVEWPKSAPHFNEAEFAERTLALLKYNEGISAGWMTDSGYGWQMYYLKWNPGRVSKYLSRSHYPTVCLPATGMKLVSEVEQWDCWVKGVRIPFTTYLFEENGRSVYVLHAIIEDRPLRAGEHIAYRQVGSDERLQSVLHGERNLGQRVIGIALRGVYSAMDAKEVASNVLQTIIVPDHSAPAQVSLLKTP